VIFLKRPAVALLITFFSNLHTVDANGDKISNTGPIGLWLSMARTEPIVYQALIIHVMWQWEIIVLMLPFPMDSKSQFRPEIEHCEMKGLV
jgi:hypothetical protein